MAQPPTVVAPADSGISAADVLFVHLWSYLQKSNLSVCLSVCVYVGLSSPTQSLALFRDTAGKSLCVSKSLFGHTKILRTPPGVGSAALAAAVL